MTDIRLSVRDLRKTFEPGLFEANVEVLKGLSFEVERGEIFGFLGPNGAGKTTTIKAITEIIYPDSGEITVCGLPHTALEAKRRIDAEIAFENLGVVAFGLNCIDGPIGA